LQGERFACKNGQPDDRREETVREKTHVLGNGRHLQNIHSEQTRDEKEEGPPLKDETAAQFPETEHDAGYETDDDGPLKAGQRIAGYEKEQDPGHEAHEKFCDLF
jgi:hypothetical protein